MNDKRKENELVKAVISLPRTVLKDHGLNTIEEETEFVDKQFKVRMFKESRIAELESIKDSGMVFVFSF